MGGEHDGHDIAGPLRGIGGQPHGLTETDIDTRIRIRHRHLLRDVGSMRPPRERINLGIVTSA
jgi:hypothetical protein